MRIADGIEVLEIVMRPQTPANLIHPMLLWDEQSAVLVDTGLPANAQQIREAIERAGVPLNKLTHVLLTHQDVDHIGGVAGLLGMLEHPVEILAHAADKPYIEGEKPLVKLAPERLNGMFEALSEEQREAAKEKFLNGLKCKVDRTIEDGEVLPYVGGIKVVYTPGHTPGHVSLYIERSKLLIAGDAMVAPGGQLQGPMPQVTPDMDLALKSVSKFTELDIETVVCYHGGLVQGNIQEQLAEVLGKTSKA